MDNVDNNEFSRETVKNKLELFFKGKNSKNVEGLNEETQTPIVDSSSDEGFEAVKPGSCCGREVVKKVMLCMMLSMICKISAIILFSGIPEFAAVKASFAATAVIGGAGIVAGITLIIFVIYSVVSCIQARKKVYYQEVD